MWVALFDFCLFILLFSFFLFGLQEWNNLIAEPDDEEGSAVPPFRDIPGRRFALWVLVIGLGGVSVLNSLLDWLRV